MAIPSFGVTYETIEAEFIGFQLADLRMSVSRWITQAAARLEVHLRQQGYQSSTIEGYGTSDSLYQLCSNYIIALTCGRLARASTQQNPDLAQSWDQEAVEIEQLIRTHTESLTGNWDPNNQRGTFQSHVRLNKGERFNTNPVLTGFWHPGMSF